MLNIDRYTPPEFTHSQLLLPQTWYAPSAFDNTTYHEMYRQACGYNIESVDGRTAEAKDGKKLQPNTSIGTWNQLAAYDNTAYRERYKLHIAWEAVEIKPHGGNRNPNFLNKKITEQDILNE